MPTWEEFSARATEKCTARLLLLEHTNFLKGETDRVRIAGEYCVSVVVLCCVGPGYNHPSRSERGMMQDGDCHSCWYWYSGIPKHPSDKSDADMFDAFLSHQPISCQAPLCEGAGAAKPLRPLNTALFHFSTTQPYDKLPLGPLASSTVTLLRTPRCMPRGLQHLFLQPALLPGP